MRRHLMTVCLLGIAGVLVLAATVDHHAKQARQDRAELREWYCQHRGTRCGGPSSSAIDRRWDEREIGYEIAVAALLAGAVVFGAMAEARRRH